MDAMHRFLAILLADMRERMRTPRFWVVLGLMTWATWWCFPPLESGYSTLTLVDGSRGFYSSAWAGMGLALIYSTLLNLFGFYLVRGTLVRDIETRVWQLLVTTPMTRAGYLLAKWTSHMAMFGMIAIVGMLVALAAQWIRAEDRHIDLIELIKPLALIGLPSLALTAMFAIWFDLMPWLRRTAGNVLFFIVWATMLTLSAMSAETISAEAGPTNAGGRLPEPRLLEDPSGMMAASREFVRVRQAQTGKPVEFGFNLGGNPAKRDLVRFEWATWRPETRTVASRAVWLAIALVLTLLAAPLLDWAASRGLSAAKREAGGGRFARWRDRIFDRLLDPFARGPLGILAVAEAKLALRQRRAWWWLAALGVLGVQCATPEAMQVGLLLAWVLPLDILARGVLREREHGTAPLVFTAPGILPRLLAARFLIGFSMLLLLSAPALARMLATEPLSALAALTAMASIASWGLCLGALCRNARPFELLMVGAVYVCLQGASLFAVATQPLPTLTLHALGLLPAWLLLAWSWPRLARR